VRYVVVFGGLKRDKNRAIGAIISEKTNPSDVASL